MKNKLKKSVFLLSSLMMLSVGVGFVNGVENTVNVAEAADSTTYTFSSYTAGTQYADNEAHVLDDVVTVTTTECHFTTQLRIYSSSTHDGFAVVKSTKPITGVSMNIGYNADTLNIFGSVDGSTWSTSTIGTLVSTSTYKDYSCTFNDPYNYLKFDVAGTQQLRIQKMTLTFGDTNAPSVSVSGISNHTQVGGTINLEATLSNISGDVTWSSSDNEIATVSNGVVTANKIGSATITADVNGTKGTFLVKVYPTENTELTIEEANVVCELAGSENSPYSYSVKGKVDSIEEYNEQYDNVRFTLSDGTNSIGCYRISGGKELEVGDEIVVTGYLTNYSGNTKQFVQGSTYEYVDNGQLATPTISFDETNAVIIWNEVNGASGYQLCVLDGEANEVVNETINTTSYDVSAFANGDYYVTVKALGNNNHSDSDESDILEFTLAQGAYAQFAAVDTKSLLGFAYEAETVGQETTSVLSFADTGNRTSQTTTQQVWKQNEITFTNDKAGSTNNVANYSNPVRLYKSSSITVDHTNLISKIVFNCTSGYVLNIDSTDNYTVETDATVVTVTFNDAVDTFTVSSLSAQTRFSSIEVTTGDATTSYTFTDVRVRFSATISKEVYESLNITKAGFEVEAAGWSKTMDIDCTGNFDTNENGDYFIICSIWNIPEEVYDTVLTATAYFEVDGTRYYAQSTSYSVVTLTAGYLEASVYSTLTENAQNAVTAFNAQLA